jgi:hypothetical protein
MYTYVRYARFRESSGDRLRLSDQLCISDKCVYVSSLIMGTGGNEKIVRRLARTEGGSR